MGSTDPIRDMSDEELEHSLDVAYGDLCYIAARIVAIQRRLEPAIGPLDALATVLYELNCEADKIIARADTA